MSLSRRERLREATIEEIKAVARRQMAEEGVANISLRGIARQMGMSAPALYRYFASYDKLITALIADAYTSLGEAMALARETVSATAYGEQLHAIAHAYRDWAIMYPEDYLLIYGTPIPGYDAPIKVIGPPAKRIWSIFFEILLDAQAAGEFVVPNMFNQPLPNYEQMQEHLRESLNQPVDVSILHHAVTLWTQLHGLIMAELTGRFRILGGEPFQLEVRYMVERLGLAISSQEPINLP